MDDYQDILTFWFGILDEDGNADPRYSKRWFQSDPGFDDEVRTLFAKDLDRAIAGHYDHWRDEPQSRLALLILLDQFSRNIFRGSHKAFAQDAKAQQLVEEGLALGQDQELATPYRLFFYLPLMHAEDRALQALCVEQYRQLHGQAPASAKALVQNSLHFAQEHQAIIDRFGRFPYRNKVLSRANTADEQAWLRANPGGYGQA
ncbi:DUF924 family protein [Gallaecimonas xiamenensis]|uniref:Transmembrane protein n=1 Tax=Gallaecimonas xiamenensis 3-C-1 TaxID=745411 RepID=K2ICT3_9GAMM|nr:DUF924 family protein [Gallaecimonas xiamenensis]EKE67751.1 hypothetical protein B3C1_18081 [Gallaecimonas xiamenensis 3-C-1]